MAISKFLVGTAVQTPSLGRLEILADHLIGIDEDGHIAHIAPLVFPSSTSLLEQNPQVSPVFLPPGTFLLPAFVDLHLHAPQFLYQGTGLDLPLMQWLDRYALAAEERIDADPILAVKVYQRLAQRLCENGTGTVLLFGTINQETNLILAKTMLAAGLRAFIGKLSMDIPLRPTYTESSPSSALASAKSFIAECRALTAHLPPHLRLVAPVITPRFVPTCSNDLLHALGQLAKDDWATHSVNKDTWDMQKLRIQSHMAEAKDQVEWVNSSRGADDMDIFQKHGLLTPHTIQAHCTFLSPSTTSPTAPLPHLASLGTAIAHCPLSNTYFSALPFPLREALTVVSPQLKLGLGTDIAGGYSADIMSAMRAAVITSRTRESARVMAQSNPAQSIAWHVEEKITLRSSNSSTDPNLAITWQESLYLATRGGALALGYNKHAGLFEVGAPFDAQCVKLFDPITLLGTGALDFFDLEIELETNELQDGPTISTQRNNPTSTNTSNASTPVNPRTRSTIEPCVEPDPGTPTNPKTLAITPDMVEKWWCAGDARNRVGMWVQGVKLDV